MRNSADASELHWTDWPLLTAPGVEAIGEKEKVAVEQPDPTMRAEVTPSLEAGTPIKAAILPAAIPEVAVKARPTEIKCNVCGGKTSVRDNAKPPDEIAPKSK